MDYSLTTFPETCTFFTLQWICRYFQENWLTKLASFKMNWSKPLSIKKWVSNTEVEQDERARQ